MLLLKRNAIEIRATDYFASFLGEKVCGMQDIPGQIHGIKGQFNKFKQMPNTPYSVVIISGETKKSKLITQELYSKFITFTMHTVLK